MGSSPFQLRLPKVEFVSGQALAGRYVPLVQNYAGERDALLHAAPHVWDAMTPLVVLVARRNRSRMVRNQTVRGWVSRLHDAVGAHPCLIDLLRVAPAAHVEGSPVPLMDTVFAHARSMGMNAVPVVRVSARQRARVRMAQRINHIDRRGVALRVPVLKLVPPPSMSLDTLLSRYLDALEVDASAADLVVDLGYLSDDQDIDIAGLADTISVMLDTGPWRSAVLLGTSMPSALGGVAEGTVALLPRREWEVWRGVAAILGEGRVGFGDYVIQHPKPPYVRHRGGSNMRANLRYTVHDGTLIVRGRGAVRIVGSQQYASLCEALTRRAEFRDASFSWGDAEFAACAQGSVKPGGQTHWRAVGSSHHFALVAEQLLAATTAGAGETAKDRTPTTTLRVAEQVGGE